MRLCTTWTIALLILVPLVGACSSTPAAPTTSMTYDRQFNFPGVHEIYIAPASRTDAAESRRDTRIVGRDAAVCVPAMCDGGDTLLEQGAVASFDAVAGQQAGIGQIPKYVDADGRESMAHEVA